MRGGVRGRRAYRPPLPLPQDTLGRLSCPELGDRPEGAPVSAFCTLCPSAWATPSARVGPGSLPQQRLQCSACVCFLSAVWAFVMDSLRVPLAQVPATGTALGMGLADTSVSSAHLPSSLTLQHQAGPPPPPDPVT